MKATKLCGYGIIISITSEFITSATATANHNHHRLLNRPLKSSSYFTAARDGNGNDDVFGSNSILQQSCEADIKQSVLFSRCRKKSFAIRRTHPRIFNTRGGSEDSDSDFHDEYDFDESESEEEDFDDLFDDDDFETPMDDDFQEESSLELFWKSYQKTPPFTKAYLTASFGITVAAYLTNKNQFPESCLFKLHETIFKGQIWRPITAFLNFGPFGVGYIMTAQFVWTYMATLERLNYDKPYDFWVMILFGCSSMVAGYSMLNIPPRYLGHNLSTFLVYVWSRYHEGMEVNLMELFNARAEMLPWFFLAQTALLEGELPILDLLGILFGHIYHHCKTTQVLKTPQFIVNWYNGSGPYSTAIRNKYKEISSDFEIQ